MRWIPMLLNLVLKPISISQQSSNCINLSSINTLLNNTTHSNINTMLHININLNNNIQWLNRELMKESTAFSQELMTESV